MQGEIYDGNANELVMKLLYLQSENRRKDIHFYINSPGGSVTATLAIYDTMQILTCPVATYCVGLAASGGAVLLAGGIEGQTICPASCQGHDPPAVRRRRRTSQRHRNPGQRDPQDARHAERSPGRHIPDRPIERVAKDTDRDFYMNAEEAKEYGIVDDILTKPAVADDDDDD